jgi:hypothetical protein
MIKVRHRVLFPRKSLIRTVDDLTNAGSAARIEASDLSESIQ